MCHPVRDYVLSVTLWWWTLKGVIEWPANGPWIHEGESGSTWGLDWKIIAERIFFVSEWTMSHPTRKFLLGRKFSMGLMCGVIISLGLFCGLSVPRDECFGQDMFTGRVVRRLLFLHCYLVVVQYFISSTYISYKHLYKIIMHYFTPTPKYLSPMH